MPDGDARGIPVCGCIAIRRQYSGAERGHRGVCMPGKGMPFDLRLPSSKLSAVGAMTREQLDAELRKGVKSIKEGKVYSADEVDMALAREFGI